jgi:hypothetical protein
MIDGSDHLVEIEAHHLGGASELFTLAPGEEQEFAAKTTRFVVRALEADEQPRAMAEVPLAVVGGQYVPAEEHPDADVAVQAGELYQPAVTEDQP